MTSYLQWFSFSKYTLYIWSAYGVVVVVLLSQLLMLKQKRRRILRWLKRQNGVQ